MPKTATRPTRNRPAAARPTASDPAPTDAPDDTAAPAVPAGDTDVAATPPPADTPPTATPDPRAGSLPSESPESAGQPVGLLAAPRAEVPAVAPVSGAPTSGAPTGMPDLKVVMVAGILGDHPDGVTAADVIDQSGLRAPIVGRALVAMEAAGAARRLPPTEAGTGPELWARGDADPATVDLANAPTHTECPTCGHRTRVRTVGVTRGPRSTEPGRNGDGQATLRKGELRALVLDLINGHPDGEFTAGIIARELTRSSGAVQNNLDVLLAQGLIQHADGDPRKVTALTPATD